MAVVLAAATGDAAPTTATGNDRSSRSTWEDVLPPSSDDDDDDDNNGPMDGRYTATWPQQLQPNTQPQTAQQTAAELNLRDQRRQTRQNGTTGLAKCSPSPQWL